MPKELILARGCLLGGKGVGAVGTLNRPDDTAEHVRFWWITFMRRTYLLSGLRLSSLIFGGMMPCSRDRTTLIRLANPAEPSQCPIFGLTL